MCSGNELSLACQCLRVKFHVLPIVTDILTITLVLNF